MTGANLRHVTGPVPLRGQSAVLDHGAALSRAERVFLTAHPAEAPSSVVLRAGDAALESYLDDALEARRSPADRPAVDLLRRSFAGHLAERLPDDPEGALHAEVIAAAVVAALDLALREWLAAGARKERAPACRERFRAVAPLLPAP